MTFLTFIYKLGNNKKIYYAKYCTDYISNDHDGLDIQVKYSLKNGLNKFRKNNGKK